MTAQELIAFQPSATASARFEKTEGLLSEEREELERVMEVERVLSLAKARAQARLIRREAAAAQWLMG